MSHKVLTAAIAAALAAPMAAQAVDFTISGQVNRALVVTDTDAGTSAGVQDNGGSSSRIRANGSSELADGSTINIQFEYEVGGSHDKTAGSASPVGIPVIGDDELDDGKGGTGINLRHANIQYRGTFGAITVGQGSEAGDASQYSDTTGVVGLAHGSINAMGSYFGSLDSGGRTNMIRYDTPALGPVSAAVSLGNGDSVSGLLKLSTEVAGSTFGAKLGTLRAGGGKSSIGASFGSTLANGLTISGAWAKGKDQDGALIAGTPRSDWLGFAVNPAHNFNTAPDGAAQNLTQALGAIQGAQLAVPADGVDAYDALAVTNLVARFTNMDAAGLPLADGSELSYAQKRAVIAALDTGADQSYSPDVPGVGDASGSNTVIALGRLHAGTPDVETTVDPSYFQMEIGYIFGNTGVAMTWYQSKDFVTAGSKGTSLGLGATHNFPKAGAQVYAAVETFDVTARPGAGSTDATQLILGTKVTF